MMIKKVNESLYFVDTLSSNRPGYTSVFLVKGERSIVLDSGVSLTAENIVQGVGEAGVDPKDLTYIGLSHAHYDHAGGAHELLKLLRESGNDVVRVACAKKPSGYLSRTDILEKLLVSGRALEGEMAGVMEPIAEEDFLVLEDGDVMDLGDISVQVIETPGHANGHIAFHVPDLDFIFVGDACGLLARDKDGRALIVPTSFAPEYIHDVYIESIERIAAMGISRIGFAHFGLVADPVPALERAVETTRTIRRKATEIVNGKRSKEDVIDELEKKFGETLLSLFHDPDRVTFYLEALVEGNLVDLTRASQGL